LKSIVSSVDELTWLVMKHRYSACIESYKQGSDHK